MFYLCPANLLGSVFITFLPTVNHVLPTPATSTVPQPTNVIPTLVQHISNLPIIHVLIGCYTLAIAVLIWLAIEVCHDPYSSSAPPLTVVGTGCLVNHNARYRPSSSSLNLAAHVSTVAPPLPPPPSPPQTVTQSFSQHPLITFLHGYVILLFIFLVCLTSTACFLQPHVKHMAIHARHIVNLVLPKSSSSSFLGLFLGKLDQFEEMLDLLDPLHWFLAIPLISGLAITVYIHPNTLLCPPPLLSWSTQWIITVSSVLAIGIAVIVLGSTKDGSDISRQSESAVARIVGTRAFKVEVEVDEARETSGASEDTLVQDMGLEGDADDDPEKNVAIVVLGGHDSEDSKSFPGTNEGESENENAGIPVNAMAHCHGSPHCLPHLSGPGGDDNDDGRVNTNSSGDILPASIESRRLECTILVLATSSPPPPPQPSLSPPSLFSSLRNCSETHIPLPIPFDDDDDERDREEQSQVSNGEHDHVHESEPQDSEVFELELPRRPFLAHIPTPTPTFPFLPQVDYENMLNDEPAEPHPGSSLNPIEINPDVLIPAPPTPFHNHNYFQTPPFSDGDAHLDPWFLEKDDEDNENGQVTADTDTDTHSTSIEFKAILVPPSLSNTPPIILPSEHSPHIPTPTFIDDYETGDREEEVVLDLEYEHEYEREAGAQEELGLLKIEEDFENFGVKFQGEESEEDTEVPVEQTTPRSRPQRWAGPILTKHWPVYGLEEDESGGAQERSVLGGRDGDEDEGEDVVRVEGGCGEVSLSLEAEDLLRLGGSEWGRLLDFDAESQGGNESGWSMAVNLNGGDSHRDRDVEVHKAQRPAHTHTLTNSWDRLVDVPFSTLEKGVEDAVQAMHIRRDREREKEKERVVRAPVVITVTPPTPPRAGKGVEEEEWALTMEMSDFWREREREEDEKLHGRHLVQSSSVDVTPATFTRITVPRLRASFSSPVSGSSSSAVRSSLNTVTPGPWSSLPDLSPTITPTLISTHASGSKSTPRLSLPAPSHLPSPPPSPPMPPSSGSKSKFRLPARPFMPTRSTPTQPPSSLPSLSLHKSRSPSPTAAHMVSRLPRVKSPSFSSSSSAVFCESTSKTTMRNSKTHVRSPFGLVTNKTGRVGIGGAGVGVG